MDEPFSSLDALTREHLQTTVLSLWPTPPSYLRPCDAPMFLKPCFLASTSW